MFKACWKPCVTLQYSLMIWIGYISCLELGVFVKKNQMYQTYFFSLFYIPEKNQLFSCIHTPIIVCSKTVTINWCTFILNVLQYKNSIIGPRCRVVKKTCFSSVKADIIIKTNALKFNASSKHNKFILWIYSYLVQVNERFLSILRINLQVCLLCIKV